MVSHDSDISSWRGDLIFMLKKRYQRCLIGGWWQGKASRHNNCFCLIWRIKRESLREPNSKMRVLWYIDHKIDFFLDMPGQGEKSRIRINAILLPRSWRSYSHYMLCSIYCSYFYLSALQLHLEKIRLFCRNGEHPSWLWIFCVSRISVLGTYVNDF